MVWNPESTLVWNPESRRLEYGIQRVEIQNPDAGIRNLDAGIRNPGSSWILLHRATSRCLCYDWSAYSSTQTKFCICSSVMAKNKTYISSSTVCFRGSHFTESCILSCLTVKHSLGYDLCIFIDKHVSITWSNHPVYTLISLLFKHLHSHRLLTEVAFLRFSNENHMGLLPGK